jgi:hypothetical protein
MSNNNLHRRNLPSIAKCFSIAFLTLIILSCHTNANSQNTAVPKTENDKNEAALHTAPVSEQTETTETAGIINMTLIPSVEPELLRNVMPNSWRKLSRLTETEEQAFIRENAEVLLEIERPIRNRNIHRYYSIYRQYVGIDTFYRILLTADNNPDFMSRAISFTQHLIYEGAPIRFNGTYNGLTATQGGYYVSFFSLDIISVEEKAKGIMITELGFSGTGNPNWSIDAIKRNGQIYGSSSCEYYFMDDLLNGNRSPVRITASNCLVDPDVPLRYSLQNAFDGEPSTSYVENTEDNLIYIDLLYTNYREIKQIAIINGYAQNRDLYIKNNRVREISFDTYQLNSTQTELEQIFLGRLPLEDNTLDYQFITIEEPARLKISAIFLGTVYNDTCIAELNFLTDNGWLFGDINEQQ